MPQLVEQHIIRKGDHRWQAIDQAAFKSKNIYNTALYRIRQHYFATQAYLRYEEVEKGFKSKDLPDDQRLQIGVVQQVLRQVDKDWKSYFAALKAWHKNSQKFTGKPRLPNYKDKEKGRNLLVFADNAVSKPLLRNGIIQPSGLDLQIPTKVQPTQFNQVRITPKSTHYLLEVVYTVETPKETTLNKQHILGIDLGIDNLATLASNQPGFTPLLVNGKPLKAINQGYNKEKARLQANLPENRHFSNRLDILTFKRNCRVKDYLHRVSRRIIDLMVEQNIGTLVIGKNDGWKQSVNLGKRNNQQFVQIPHAFFTEMLQYKGALVGIDVVLTEESYTSKCSFLDHEPLEKRESYLGRRVRRSEFVTSTGKSIHADVNGAYNIIRKVFPNAFDASGIEASAVTPVRVKSLTTRINI